MLRQCEFSIWDLKTHLGLVDTYEILAEVREKTALISAIDDNRFLNTFGHIFAGGYAAGYFSYKWAEVLAADAYYYVQQQGGIGSQASLDFLRNILETGGSQDFMVSYELFRGKKPEINALLQANGIVN
jgi:oligopeptidase A